MPRLLPIDFLKVKQSLITATFKHKIPRQLLLRCPTTYIHVGIDFTRDYKCNSPLNIRFSRKDSATCHPDRSGGIFRP